VEKKKPAGQKGGSADMTASRRWHLQLRRGALATNVRGRSVVKPQTKEPLYRFRRRRKKNKSEPNHVLRPEKDCSIERREWPASRGGKVRQVASM